MEQYKYDFSVVMAVYNVEAYLREAVNSIVHQTIGFSHIQLILVDDGSKDNSGKICDEYKEKYPNNVVVIHKENGGVSSARNLGLSFVEGRYLNFMDSDDKMDPSAFRKVRRFFQKHEKETDVACIPLKFFGADSGEHIQNAKFQIKKEVIDLYEYPYVTNLSSSSSFFCTESTKGFEFDTKLTSAEDAKYCLDILMQKMTLGLVPDATYWYRKRLAGEQSATQTSYWRTGWYIPYLRLFSIWALDASKQKFGVIPRFVQYEVMYDLQWKLNQTKIPAGVLSPLQQDEYRELLFKVIEYIDDEVILQQNYISETRKMFLLCKKHADSSSLSLPYSMTKRKSKVSKDGVSVGDIVFCFSDTSIIKISKMRTILDFIRIDTESNTCILEGFHHINGIDERETEPVLLVNGQMITCERIDRGNRREGCLGETITETIGFRCRIPLLNRRFRVIPALLIDDTLIMRKTYQFGKFFPLSEVYSNAYAINNNHFIELRDSTLCITAKPSWVKKIVRECRLLTEIWKKDLTGGRKAVAGRIFYHAYMPFKRKKIWIIADRLMKADDNGEAVFRYLSEHPLKDTNVYFVINNNSKDYKRLSAMGKCLCSMSFRHKLLHLVSDAIISSHADEIRNPFLGYHDALRDLLCHQRFVFLQHGVTKDDLSNWLDRYNQNIDGFVTSAVREAKSIEEGNYHYDEGQIWLTGFPRFDLLYRDEKKWITVMPTWRRYLVTVSNGKTGQWGGVQNFEDTEFFKFYNELLNSERLLSNLKQQGYTLVFFPHPNLQGLVDKFSRDKRVIFLPPETSYREIYAKSDLIVTDYSSTVFDFAYLRKPVIYAQFDKEEFFSGAHNYSKGYFDYERDGFGEVAYDLNGTISMIEKYIKNGCVLSDTYRNRIDSFFAFNDKKNCQRVLEKVLSLSER